MTALSSPVRADEPMGTSRSFASTALNLLRQREVQLVLAILAVGALSAALHPDFLASSNISFILADSVSTMIVAVGQTVVVIGRGIDLSVSPILGIAAIGVGFPAQDHNLNIFLALLFVLLIGTALGIGICSPALAR